MFNFKQIQLNKMNYLTLLLLIIININDSQNILFDFNEDSSLSSWVVVDDGVMGGLSKGSITLNENGHAEFKGYVTTENNGGFSSIRYNFTNRNVSNYTHVVLKLKGDKKNYQFRLKKSKYDRASYITTFKTSGDWEEIRIPLIDFYPSFRGYRLKRPNYDSTGMEEIAFLIANKKNENFKLTIDKIYLE